MPTEMKVPQRNKHWSELTSDEKIERLREIVKRLESQNSNLRETVDNLREHQHIDGTIVIPMKRHYSGDVCEGMPSDDVYF